MKTEDDLFDCIRSMIKTGMTQDLDSELHRIYGETCAPVVMDSCGFTRITRSHGNAYFLERIVRTRDIVEPVFRKHGCIRWDTHADNIYSEFPNPAAALNAAIETLTVLKSSGLMITDTEPYRLCTGIGYGPVLRSEKEGVYGDEMNLASKLAEDTANGDEILLTESAFAGIPPEKKSLFTKLPLRVSGVSMFYYRAFYFDLV